MQRIISVLLLVLLVGCSQTSTQPTDIGVNSEQVLDGPAIASQLTTLYETTPHNCGGDSRPAFLCSGLVIRQTVKDPLNKYKVWEPSPTSIKSQGVSFSFIRADANFGAGGWRSNANGYIVWPIFEAPRDKEDLQYLCFYPMDAYGWMRSTTEVCGPHPDYPVQSQLCQYANVTTAEQWLAVWQIPGGNSYKRQCGFDIRDERSTLAGPAFYESLRAKNLLGAMGFNAGSSDNEIIARTWTSRDANKFPIMAFFYVQGAASTALTDAQYNQLDFYNSTNPKLVIPIIRITRPASFGAKATFSYIVGDQAVTQ